MKAIQNHKTQANCYCRICHAYLREKNRAKREKKESCKVKPRLSKLQFHHIIQTKNSFVQFGLKYDELIFIKKLGPEKPKYWKNLDKRE